MKLKLFLATATLLAIVLSPLVEANCLADEGQPIAIRKWERRILDRKHVGTESCDRNGTL